MKWAALIETVGFFICIGIAFWGVCLAFDMALSDWVHVLTR